MDGHILMPTSHPNYVLSKLLTSDLNDLVSVSFAPDPLTSTRLRVPKIFHPLRKRLTTYVRVCFFPQNCDRINSLIIKTPAIRLCISL